MALPASAEEWRGIELVTLDEANAYRGKQIYRVQGRIANIHNDIIPCSGQFSYDITIKLLKEGTGTSYAYALFLHNVSGPNTSASKEIIRALEEVKASQLECTVGVNQVNVHPILNKHVNYLWLPPFFEMLIKNRRVILSRLPVQQHSEAMAW